MQNIYLKKYINHNADDIDLTQPQTMKVLGFVQIINLLQLPYSQYNRR